MIRALPAIAGHGADEESDNAGERVEGKDRTTPLLEVSGASKAFGAVQALSDASIRVRAGEVVGLVGDNGAGKSTLVKILSGVYAPDTGKLEMDGKPVGLKSPADAKAHGIETVFQDLALVDTFDIPSNFFLGRELTARGIWKPLRLLRHREMKARANETMARLKISLGDSKAAIAAMSGGQRQAVAIARAAFWKGRVLLLDEPTAALGVRESAEVGRLMKHMATEDGMGLIVVSHDMEAVLELCDRVFVLRRGVTVAELDTATTDREELVAFITGAKL